MKILKIVGIHSRMDIVKLTPLDKIPKRIYRGFCTKKSEKIDHYDFKGEYNITILRIKGGEIQE